MALARRMDSTTNTTTNMEFRTIPPSLNNVNGELDQENY
jgi:hypothetical protein